MSAITLNLSDNVVQKASQAANVLHCSVEELLAHIVERSLPSVDDLPEAMRTELLQMTWLEDAALLEISQAEMQAEDQQRLTVLAAHQGNSDFSAADNEELQALRDRYGEVTLRKARALALLSLRGGKPLLAEVE